MQLIVEAAKEQEVFQMVRINGNYPAADYYNNAAKNEVKGGSGTNSKKTNSAGNIPQTHTSGLSSKAQEYLDKLNKSYDNMEFFVADFDKGDTAEEVLSRSTKEVSIILSSEELEKMASDEKYEQKCMKNVQGALRMSEQINREFGFESAYGKNKEESTISKIAVSFNSDGTTSIFAELEKSSSAQRDRIEKAREDRRAEKREQEKKVVREKRDAHTKHTVVEASSVEELMKKIAAVDWNTVKFDDRTESGSRFDFSI